MENPKVLVAITSYNRLNSLCALIDALQEPEQRIIPDIVVFDDCTPNLTILRCPGVRLIQSPEHRGKAGFWQTYNDLMAYVKDHPEYEYVIILPDDVEPCPDFVSEAIEAYHAAGDPITLSPFLTNRSVLPGISRWGQKKVIPHETYYTTHYFDCCGVVKRNFFEALGWHMDAIEPCANPYRSSGVGRQITMRLQAKRLRMCHVRRTLLATTEDPSEMNPEERKLHPMFANWRDNADCVDVHMASLYRDGHVLKTAETLLRQPELHTLFITLNAYTDEQYQTVQKGLDALAVKYGATIVTRRGDNKKGSNEKMSMLTHGTAPYFAFADDDILYPEDYLLRLIHGCNVHRAAVSFHGGILKQFPVTKYYNGDRRMLSWNIPIISDTRADIIGNGLALFRRDWFTEDELRALYDDAPFTSMDDILMSALLAKKGIERWVIAHPAKCIRIKPAKPSDGYVYEQYKDNDWVQVEYINRHFTPEMLVQKSQS